MYATQELADTNVKHPFIDGDDFNIFMASRQSLILGGDSRYSGHDTRGIQTTVYISKTVSMAYIQEPQFKIESEVGRYRLTSAPRRLSAAPIAPGIAVQTAAEIE